MKTMKWLVQREFWEHKGAIFWAPIVVASAIVLFIGGSVMYAISAGKFGGDSMGELIRHDASYRIQLKAHTERVETEPAPAAAAPVNWDPPEAFEVADDPEEPDGAGQPASPRPER